MLSMFRCWRGKVGCGLLKRPFLVPWLCDRTPPEVSTMKIIAGAIFLLAMISITFGQDIQVNRQNKTIAVTADEPVTADPEVAVLALGYHNYAATQAAAFEDNVRTSNTVIKALLAGGISNSDIETEKIRLGRIEP